MSGTTPPIPVDHASARYSKTRTVPHFVWPLTALLLLLIFNFFFTPGFVSIHIGPQGQFVGSLIDVLKWGSPTILLALGMTLVIATAGVDLSVGSVMAISGTIAACLLYIPSGSEAGYWQSHIWAVVAACLAAGLVLGCCNGALVAFFNLQPIIATLILMVAGRGIAQEIASISTRMQKVDIDPASAFCFIGKGSFLKFPFPVSIAVVAFLVVLCFSRLTAAGLFIESVGNNPAASRLAGVRSSFVKFFAYAITGLLAAVAGLIPTANLALGDPAATGQDMELDAILAVVVGGTSLNGGRFNLVGTVIGALLVQTLTTTVLARDIRPPFTLVLKGSLVVAVCLLQAPRFREMMTSLYPARSK
jgi:ribose/xylose/arabinose/galactoside ABC-type transport system permease subunit